MGIEPMMRVLQTLALPLGDVAAGQIIHDSLRICHRNSGCLRLGKWNSPVELQQNARILSIIGSSDPAIVGQAIRSLMRLQVAQIRKQVTEEAHRFVR
jgi:hypothetical protein